MKTRAIQVIVGALGMIKRRTQKHVNEIPGNLSLAKIQKIVLNRTAQFIRRTPSLKTKQFFNTHYFPSKLYFDTNYILTFFTQLYY